MHIHTHTQLCSIERRHHLQRHHIMATCNKCALPQCTTPSWSWARCIYAQTHMWLFRANFSGQTKQFSNWLNLFSKYLYYIFELKQHYIHMCLHVYMCVCVHCNLISCCGRLCASICLSGIWSKYQCDYESNRHFLCLRNMQIHTQSHERKHLIARFLLCVAQQSIVSDCCHQTRWSN